jgi:23S rRNA (guanosine2251-2'-O)-methyltransferase
MEQSDFIFGMRPVTEAIQSGQEINKILLKSGGRSENLGVLMALIHQHSIPFQYVPEEKLNRVTRKNHQGVIAFLSSVEYQDIEKLLPMLFEAGKTPLILILDNVTDVRNFGSIARSAECAGADAILIPVKGSALINADAIKTSAGALNYIPVCRTLHLKNTVEFLQASGLQILAATEKAEKDFYTADLTRPTAIILGAEDTGISTELLRIAEPWVKIPLSGSIASLNVSVAAGILLFEAVKQRKLYV